MKGREPRALALLLLCLFVSSGPALVSAGTLPNTTQWSETDIGGTWNGAVNIQWGPDGRMYVVERAGRVWIIEPNGTRLSQPFIDISDEVGGWRDYGLLGFVLHPNFQSNGYVYLLYVVDHYALFNLGLPGYDSGTNEHAGFPTIGRITRYTADPAAGRTRVIVSSRKVLVGESPSTGFPIMHDSHGVGALAWGMDGTLLGVSGDGACYNHTDQGSDSDTYYSRAQSDGIIGSDQNIGALRSQYLGSLSGKMIRIDPDTGDGLPSNPFFDPGNPRSSRSRVWALGLRNPYRFVRKPGTGSHNPADGIPGTFYVGDVGWNNAEDFHVVTQAGQNLGWPVFEGYVARYSGNIYNRQAKNPLYNGGSCTREFFYFSDLVKQESQNPISFPNPCDAGQQIPDSWTDGSGTTWTISKFEHSRPALSWRGNAQAPTFDASGNATTCQVGASGCVPGPQFSGDSSTGGVWYTGTDFPATFQNSYFHADFGGQWIKALKLDASDRVTQVTNFLSGEAIVFVSTHPTQGGLYYVSWGEGSTGRVRKITYTASGNQPPRAAASPEVSFGPSPLAVNLSSAGSVDPEGQPLQYLWNFGDGTPTSAAANPAHTFTAPSANPARFDVRLRVTDNGGSISEKLVLVSPNNTPPAVDIVSPPAGTLYPMDRDQPYTLAAEITDLEHPESQLSCQWLLALHHNDHTHSEPAVNACTTTLFTSPAGCDGNTYFFRASLTVTDAMGLATTRSIDVYPDCPNTQPDLAVAVADSPDPAAAGSQVAYTLTVTNNGRGLAAGATLTDVLPAGVQLVSVNPSAGCTTAGQTITCALGDLSPGANRTITVLATPTGFGVFTNVATVSTPTAEANLTNNQGSAMTAVSPVASGEPPVAQSLSLTTNEDTALPVTLSATDPEGQPVTFSVLTQPGKGVLSGAVPNLTYTPNANVTGADSFTYVATDNGGRSSAVATVSIQIIAVNDPPLAASQSVTVAQNATAAIALTATDVDGGALAFTVLTPPAHGTLTGSAPTLTYTPATGYSGPDAFTFKANDGAADSAPATVSITVVAAPGSNWWDLRWSGRRRLVMNAAARTTNLVDFPLLVRLDATRIDYAQTQAGGRDLRFVDADGTTVLAHDVESWTPGGTSYVWVKVPRIDAGSTTDHVWMYYGNSAAADGQNRAGLWGSTYRGVWHLQDATDASVNGRIGTDSGSTAATGRIGGARRFDGVSNNIIVPHSADLTFTNTASFSLSAWVQLSALPTRFVGVAGKTWDGVTGWYGIWLSDTRRWIAGGPTDLTGSVAVTGWTHVAVVQDGPANARRLYINGAQAASGTAKVATGTGPFWIGGEPSDGEFVAAVVDEVRLAGLPRSADWVAAEFQSESDTFLTFVADPTTPNLPPSANGSTPGTSEDTPVSLVLTGTDPEGQSLTFAIVSGPLHGALSGAAPNLVYTPAANYNGADSFTFRVTDAGGASSAPATVAITVAPVNDPPSAAALAVSTPAQTAVALTLAGSDPDGDVLAFQTLTAPAHGTLLGVEPNLTYTPANGYVGPDAFNFRVSDPSGSSASATVSITITPVNAPPMANAATSSTDEDTPVAVLLTGSDPEGQALTYTVTTTPAHGSLSGTAPALTYTPAANYFGPDAFAFQVRDTQGATSAPALVSITVAAVNDAPIASFTATPSSGAPPLLVTLNAAASVDPDGAIASYAWSFGDGTTGAGSSTTHTYATAGTYTITLTVVDDAGAPAVTTRTVSALAAPWWNTAWTERRKLTFDNQARTSNLANFPVLVTLDPSRLDYTKTRSGGADLRFVDANGTTTLAYEIEQWNAGGISTVWVRVPQIDGASAADHIWMYYGNATASSGQNRNSVWSASFNAVWHLTSSSTDSTGKSHSGTNQGATAVTGRLGGAHRFNGTSARIRVANASDLRFSATASFTLTAWVQLDAVPSAVRSVVTKSQNTGSRYGLGTDASNRWVARGTTDVAGGTVSTPWAHLALVQDGPAGQRRLYVNGLLAATGAAQAGNGTGVLYIGGSSSASDYLAGIVDEVRIAAAARSADWIAAETASESGAFVTFTAE